MSVTYQPGKYRGEVTAQAITRAGSGNWQFVLAFNVLDRYAGGDDLEPVERSYERRVYRTLTDKTGEYFWKDMDALGFKGQNVSEVDPKNAGYYSFTGTIADFVCSSDRNLNGEPRERWSIAWPPKTEEITGEAPTAGEYRQLNALFARSKFKSSTKPVAKPVSVAPKAEPFKADDSDVPF